MMFCFGEVSGAAFVDLFDVSDSMKPLSTGNPGIFFAG